MEFESLAPDPAASLLKRSLADIILWNERTSPRSLQASIGPSEVGNPCDRRIAYRLVNTPKVNIWSDPWPAIVGTAIHKWLEVAVQRYQRETGCQEWLTEISVQPDPLVRGSSDLFHIPSGTVVDYKSTSADTIRKLRKGDPPTTAYKTQINLYGRGHVLAGRRVEKVALLYYPRSGWLDDAFVWEHDYQPEVAEAAIKRMYDIGFKVLDLDVENHPERFGEIPVTAGDNCVWCPMFNRDLDGTATASTKGCPGR